MAKESEPESLTERVVSVKKRSKTVRRIIEALPTWVTPNVVTVFRGGLSVPMFLALASGRYWIALIVFCAAMALDAVDGAIAHVRNMNSPLGAFIDPLADKLLVYGAMLALWDVLPAWITLIIGGSLIYAAGITLARVARLWRAAALNSPALARTVAAKPAGKVKTMFDVAGAVLIMSGLARHSASAVDAGGALMVAGTLVAGVVYFRRPE